MRSPETHPLIHSDILILLALFGLAGVPLWTVGAVIGTYVAREAGVHLTLPRLPRLPASRSRSHS